MAITVNHQIVSGHDNAGTLQRVNLYQDANSVYFIDPRTLPFRGLQEEAANGLERLRGYPNVTWILPLLVAQYDYIYDNLRGAVTVKVSLDGGITYANYNAYSSLPPLGSLDSSKVDFANAAGTGMPVDFVGPGYPAVEWAIKRLVAI